LQRVCADEDEESEEKDENKDSKEDKKEEDKKDEDKNEDEKKDGKGTFKAGLAVIAIAAIAMGEDVGKELCMRLFGHLVISL
jgi:26S proteasome regulatory subunit N1